MAKRKPRTAAHRRTNRFLNETNKMCEWWDDGYPECNLPWCGTGEKKCNGDIFICKKEYYHHLAFAKKPNKDALIEFERRASNGKIN